jgi:hypothetical protein
MAMEFARRILFCIALLLGAAMAPLDAPAASTGAGDIRAAMLKNDVSEKAPCDFAIAQPSCVLVCVGARPAAASAKEPGPLSLAFGRPPDQQIRASFARPDPNPPKLNLPA